MKPLRWTLQFAFGCHHGRLSRAFTIKKRTYQVCFECGQEFEYSWKLMHTIAPSTADSNFEPSLPRAAYYSVAPESVGASARQTYRYFSSLDVITGMFFSRVTRFKAERRFCIFSPLRLLSGTLMACLSFSFGRSARMSATALRCFPLR